jgi:hypothetical protein
VQGKRIQVARYQETFGLTIPRVAPSRIKSEINKFAGAGSGNRVLLIITDFAYRDQGDVDSVIETTQLQHNSNVLVYCAEDIAELFGYILKQARLFALGDHSGHVLDGKDLELVYASFASEKRKRPAGEVTLVKELILKLMIGVIIHCIMRHPCRRLNMNNLKMLIS